MKRNHFALILLALIGAAACPTLTGCSHSGTDSSMPAQDEQNFKGGPMPAAARQAMADEARQAQAKASQSPPPAPAKP